MLENGPNIQGEELKGNSWVWCGTNSPLVRSNFAGVISDQQQNLNHEKKIVTLLW